MAKISLTRYLEYYEPSKENKSCQIFPGLRIKCDKAIEQEAPKSLHRSPGLQIRYLWCLFCGFCFSSQGGLDTTICDKVCKWLVPGPFLRVFLFPQSIKMPQYNEILLKVTLNTINLKKPKPEYEWTRQWEVGGY